MDLSLLEIMIRQSGPVQLRWTVDSNGDLTRKILLPLEISSGKFRTMSFMQVCYEGQEDLAAKDALNTYLYTFRLESE